MIGASKTTLMVGDSDKKKLWSGFWFVFLNEQHGHHGDHCQNHAQS